MAVTNPRAVLDPAYESWRASVERRLLDAFGRGSAALETELGPLPFELGWASGDSAAEFVAAAVLPLVEGES
jgi:hypothetical protein